MDCCLNSDVKSYTRDELKSFVDIHADQMDTNLLSTVLDFGGKRASQIMTPIDEVFMLDISFICPVFHFFFLFLLLEVFFLDFLSVPIPLIGSLGLWPDRKRCASGLQQSLGLQ
jgi:hypothetical protein